MSERAAAASVVPSDVAPLSEGSVVAGKYRIERVIGRGGSATVYAARHTELGQEVAIKVLLQSVMSQPGAVDRFLTEGKAAARLRSAHAVGVMDVGSLESGEPYLVMEFLEGQNLDEWIVEHGRMKAGDAVDVVLQVCSALAEAHGLGIIHRDVKPANLIVRQRRDGSLDVKVLDFGISRVPSTDTERSGRITENTVLIGTPMYMSPEHLRSPQSVDARTDIWSLGVVLYECLSGVNPFEADAVPDIMVNVVERDVPPLDDAGLDLPPGLSDIVSSCLEKDRGLRFASIEELAMALQPYAARQRLLSMAPPSDPLERAFVRAPGGAGAPITLTGTSVLRHARDRRARFLAIAGGAVVAVAFVFIGNALLRSGGTAPGQTESAGAGAGAAAAAPAEGLAGSSGSGGSVASGGAGVPAGAAAVGTSPTADAGLSAPTPSAGASPRRRPGAPRTMEPPRHRTTW